MRGEEKGKAMGKTETRMKRALRLDVYRTRYGDCTNGGISGRWDELIVPCDEGYVEYDPENPQENLVYVEARIVAGINTLRLVPAAVRDKRTMFGGNYATTCDSRFGRMLAAKWGMGFRFNDILPVHDRVEG